MPDSIQAIAGGAATWVACASCLAAPPTFEPVVWQAAEGGNDHSYQLVVHDQPVAWRVARVEAERAGGHLATITSFAESRFVLSKVCNVQAAWEKDIGEGQGPWLGAFREIGAGAPDEGWRWVTGEPFEYQRWLPDKPDDRSEGQVFLAMQSGGRWTRLADDAPDVRSFVIEYAAAESVDDSSRQTADAPEEHVSTTTPVEALTTPRLVAEFAAPGSAAQMMYSPLYDLLFLRNAGSAIRVIDAKTGAEIEFRQAERKFTDIDLTPDERFLFAADFGGNGMRAGEPAPVHHIHRFNLHKRQWEVRPVETVAFRLEAVDDTRVLLLGEDQGVSLSLERWGRKISQISTLRCGYQGDIVFDPGRGRVLHGDEGISIPRMHAFRLQDQRIVRVEEMDVPEGHGPRPGGTWVLSSDGRDFYYGKLQLEAADLTNVRRVFDEPIYAATRDLALGEVYYYDARSGVGLGQLDAPATVYAVSPDGRSVWAFEEERDVLRHYELLAPAGP